MTTIKHYKSNVRDVEFNLFELYKIQEKVLGNAPFTAIDEDTSRDVLSNFAKFCEDELAVSFAEGDRTPLTLSEDGDVTLPPGIKSALDQYFEGQWHLIEHPEDLGGYGAPRSLQWSCFEFLSGANPPVGFYLLGNFMGKLINDLGTDSQKGSLLNLQLQYR